MKFPSSIFSFNIIDFKVSKLFSISLIYLFSGFLLIEVMVRYLVPDGHYPTGHWLNNEIRIQTSQFEELEDVDIIFTGSSFCSVNIPPKEFDDEMKKNGFNITSFNAGIRGVDYEGLAEGFKKLFWSHRSSNYVVLVIAPTDLWEKDRAEPTQTKSFIKTLNTSYYEADLLDFFSQSFWIFGFRNEIREFIKTRKWLYEKPLIGIRGHTPMNRKPNFKFHRINLEINKDGIVSQSLFGFVNWLVDQDVKVVVIEALKISLARERVDPRELKKFYNILGELDKIENVILLDTNEIIPQNKYFIDSGHLSLEGGKIYAKKLANKFLQAGFPW